MTRCATSSTMNDPEFYEREEVKSIAKMLIDKHVPVMIERMSWKPFESILDYGCGAGSVAHRFIYPLAEKYSSAITGVDTSKEMIQFANEKYPHTLATFQVGDIMAEDKFKWPLMNVKFDKIFCVHVIHFIQDYKEFLIRLFDQLQKGGQMAAGIPYAQYQKVHHVLSEHPKWRKYMSVMKKVRASWVYEKDAAELPDAIQSLLKSHDMMIVDFYVNEEQWSYPSVEEFVDFLLATNLGARNVPDDLKSELRQDIAKLAAELCGVAAHSKPFPVKINYVRFVAEKHS